MSTSTDLPALLFRGREPHGPNSLRLDYVIEGCYVRPTPEAEAAFARIRALLDQIDPADLALIREFHGSLVLYGMVGRQTSYSEATSEALLQQAKHQAEQRYPDHRVVDAWHYAANCQSGFSVIIVPRTKA